MPDTPAGRLRRWEDFGGSWQVVARTRTHVAISLRRCDGGEEVDRLTSDDAELLAYVDDRSAGERCT